MKRGHIAILGATSHIAKGIIYSLKDDENFSLSLYARNVEKVRSFLRFIDDPSRIEIFRINDFGNQNYDIVINCVGYGNPSKLQNSYYDFIKVTEIFDNIVIDYILKKTDCLYVNLSSGAIYGQVFDKPVETETSVTYSCNPPSKQSYYGITKFYSEMKHRALESLKIVDLRIFSYFSRFIDLDAPYLINDIINCVNKHKVFVTGSTEIWRDFIHFRDLIKIIRMCYETECINSAFNVSSKEPVSKHQLIDFFKEKYNLMVEIKKDYLCNSNTATGAKPYYYSNNIQNYFNGFFPKYTSIETINYEAGIIFSNFSKEST